MWANSILITSAILAMIAAISLPQEPGTSNVDIIPKLAGNISEPSHNMTEISPKRAGEIPPSFFYKDGHMKVRCNSPDWAYRIPPREVPNMHITFDDWTDWTLVKYEAAMVHIRSRQLGCYACRCDENGGLYGVPLHDRKKGDPGGLSRKCWTQLAANRCSVMLVSRVPENRNLPISVLQEALDSIPDSVQGHNADFTWNYGSGTLRFSQPRRYLDPDTAEPYYLEGPDIGMNQAYYQEFRRRFGIPIKIYGEEANLSGSGSGDSGGGGDGDPGGSGSGSGSGSGGPGGSGDGNPGGSGSSGVARAK
ncbi:hypothetical protein TWF679_009794 [Orbilia oligospora]|uniref:Uncharacterized protein n=1 Tax=Orbilia oligospora TaxID=2813651 RepID=A0A8H8V245_ORBOL|nr:hypothetical protein TWF679_009794 [Orbilia oligospora]